MTRRENQQIGIIASMVLIEQLILYADLDLPEAYDYAKKLILLQSEEVEDDTIENSLEALAEAVWCIQNSVAEHPAFAK